MSEEKKLDKLKKKWKRNPKVPKKIDVKKEEVPFRQMQAQEEVVEKKPNVRKKEIMHKLKNKTILLSLIAIPLLIGAALIIYPRYLAPAETDATFAMTGLSTGDIEKIYMTSGKKNECYWITPTFDRGYYLEIRKYYSETNDCYGNLLDEVVIPLDGPVNIIGNTDCICSKRMQIKRIEVDGDIFFEIKTVGII